MSLMDELRHNRTVFLAANGVAAEPERTVQTVKTPVRTTLTQPVQAGNQPAGAVYSLSAPHDVDASVKFPQPVVTKTKNAEPDIWNTVLRRMETEARFHPQDFAEEE